MCGYVYCDPSDRISVVVILDPLWELYEFSSFVITVLPSSSGNVPLSGEGSWIKVWSIKFHYANENVLL